MVPKSNEQYPEMEIVKYSELLASLLLLLIE